MGGKTGCGYVGADAIVGEDTGVGYADEKEDLLDREIEQIDAANVAGVEVPDADVGEDAIPHEEKGCYGEAGHKKVTPLAYESEPWMKGEQKGKDDTKKIDEQIKVFIRHWSACVLGLH